MDKNKVDSILSQIIDRYSDIDFLRVDGLDAAVIGVSEDVNKPHRLVYSVKKSIEILTEQQEITEDDLDEEEIKHGWCVEDKKKELATDHFEFNIKGAYMGEKTPVWCEDDFE